MTSLVWAVRPSSSLAADASPASGEAGPTGSRSASIDPAAAKRAVREAWEKARGGGVYAFATDLSQVTYPARTLANVGHGRR